MRRTVLITAVLLGVLAVAPLGVYVADRLIASGEVGRNVAVHGVDVSGLSREDAVAALEHATLRLANTPAAFIVDGQLVPVIPANIGLTADVEGVVDEALGVGRGGGLADDAGHWLSAWRQRTELDLPIAIDAAAVHSLFDEWDRTLVDQPAYEGAVLVAEGRAIPEYPAFGYVIDRERSLPFVTQAVASGNGEPVELLLAPVQPAISSADVDRAVRRANQLIDSPVTVTNIEGLGSFVFEQSVLIDALRWDVITRSPARFEVWLDAEPLIAAIESSIPGFETPPVEAVFTFDEGAEQVEIIPSVNGTTIDLEQLPGVVERAALGNGLAAMPMTVGQRPNLSTEKAAAMGPITKVSEFTTYHPCCGNRVHNIHLMADTIDGVVVWPGETFSINEYVGQRTGAKGYRRDGAIIGGELYCCDKAANVGGGVSQFGTTFYNAVFYGCYEDVKHQPHSIYFSRYPRGREATLGFPEPDVVFRNDTDAIVWIDTSYTSTSITVAFHGNTGGRICDAVSRGRNPITTTRVIDYPNGTFTRESHTWTYRLPKKPTTTTTAPAPTTTTTTVPPSTTTAPPTTTTTTAPPSTTTTTAAPTTTTVP